MSSMSDFHTLHLLEASISLIMLEYLCISMTGTELVCVSFAKLHMLTREAEVCGLTNPCFCWDFYSVFFQNQR